MDRQMYFRTSLMRNNPIKEAIFKFFLSVASIPRLMLEVFIRKNFGERYFKLSNALILAAILAVIPLARTALFSAVHIEHKLMPAYLTWYVFVVAFVVLSVKHHRDLKRNPSVFNLEKYSKYSGDLHPYFEHKLKIGKRDTDMRMIEIWIEPGFFFAVGLLLALIGQALGLLLIFTSIVYSVSYMADYHMGDNIIMDILDKRIIGACMERSFMDEADAKGNKFYRFLGRRPDNPEVRRAVLDEMKVEDEIMFAQ